MDKTTVPDRFLPPERIEPWRETITENILSVEKNLGTSCPRFPRPGAHIEQSFRARCLATVDYVTSTIVWPLFNHRLATGNLEAL